MSGKACRSAYKCIYLEEAVPVILTVYKCEQLNCCKKTQNASCKEELKMSLYNKITTTRKVLATVSISQTMKQVTHFLISKLTKELKANFQCRL